MTVTKSENNSEPDKQAQPELRSETAPSIRPEKLPVLIVGAGPVGLTVAIELARRGVAVRCIERLPAPSTRSKALLVWPRTLEVLAELADGDDMVASSLPVAAFHYHSSARAIAKIGFDPATQPVILPQPQVERLLRVAAEKAGVIVEQSTTLVGLGLQPDHVGARISIDGGEQSVDFSYVIGADGAGSTVREELGLSFDGMTYPATFMLADVLVEGAPQHDAVHYYGSPRGVLVLIGLPDGRFRVFTSAPPGFEPSGDTDVDLAQLQQMVDLRGPGGLRIHSPAWASAFSVHARRSERYRLGRVFLAGDAAHIHSPAGGQGLNTGITDAHNLAWKLAAVWHGKADPGLLDSYESERTQVAHAVVRQADLQTRAWLLRHPAAVLGRDLASKVAGRLGLFNYKYVPWLAGVLTRYRVGAVRGTGLRRGAARAFVPGALVPAFAVQDAVSGVIGGSDVPLRVTLQTGKHTLLLLGTGRSEPGDGQIRREQEFGGYRREGLLQVRMLQPGRRLVTPAAGAGFSAMVLVRPDGHIAAVAGVEGGAGVRDYLSAYFPRPVTAAGIDLREDATGPLEGRARVDPPAEDETQLDRPAGDRERPRVVSKP